MKKIKLFAFAVAAVAMLGACNQKGEVAAEAEVASTDNIYQFTVLDGDLNPVSLADYQGKVLLVVNTATACGFTPQYAELQKMYAAYGGRGLEILDFPCNQFGQQAPGSNEEIREFCTGTYQTTFRQLAKIEVNGNAEDVSPLYVWLKEQAPFAGFDTTDPRGAYMDKMMRAQDPAYYQSPDIKWNFTKFLVDREGNVVRRFEPTEPMETVEKAIEVLL